MRIIIETAAYNSRRDGAPWIYKIGSWAAGSKLPEVAAWGSFMGERGYGRGGDESYLEIAADPGDIIRWGQNDMRGHSHTYRQYGVVMSDGTVDTITDARARELALKPTTEQLPTVKQEAGA